MNPLAGQQITIAGQPVRDLGQKVTLEVFGRSHAEWKLLTTNHFALMNALGAYAGYNVAQQYEFMPNLPYPDGPTLLYYTTSSASQCPVAYNGNPGGYSVGPFGMSSTNLWYVDVDFKTIPYVMVDQGTLNVRYSAMAAGNVSGTYYYSSNTPASQVYSLTVTSAFSVGDIIIIIAQPGANGNYLYLDYVTTTTSTTSVASDLASAINANAPLFGLLSASTASGATITITGNTVGQYFTMDAYTDSISGNVALTQTTAANPGSPVPDTQFPALVVPTATLEWTTYNLLSIPTATIFAAMQTPIDTSGAFGSAAGTLMYLTTNSTRRMTVTGVEAWDCTHSFAYNGAGWNNAFWAQYDGGSNAFVPIVNQAGQPPYALDTGKNIVKLLGGSGAY